MKTSKNVKIRNTKKSRLIALTAVALLVSSVIFTLLHFGANKTAYANGNIDAQKDSTFSVLFPYDSLNYVQSDDPTLIAANGDYLIIYDKTAKTMFVRGGERIGTYAFPLNLDKKVSYIKAVGNTAFIHADGDNYTVNLKDTSALPVKRELPSPDLANYFRSDGEYLYAKNGAGAVTIYDENLEVVKFMNGTQEVTVDNHTYYDEDKNPAFSNDIVLAGNDHLLYLFKTKESSPEFIVYDPVTKTKLVHQSMRNYIREAYVGKNIIVGQLARSEGETQNTRLVGIDKNTGATIFPSDITPDSFCVYGNRLYTIEGKQIMTYTLEQSADGNYTGFKKMSTISMSGNDTEHLDSPSDVITFKENTVVADTANKRLGYINSISSMSVVSLDASPLRLATDNIGIFALCDNQSIVKIENNQKVQTLSADGAIDITYLDKLYLLRDDGLYTVLGGEMLKLADIAGAKRLTSVVDGSNLYIIKDNGIDVYSTNGTLLCSLAQDFESAVDISVDYAGQIFVLRADGFDVYVNDSGTLVRASQTEFYNETAHVNANSLCVDGKSLCFSTEECLIGKSDVISYSKDNYISVPYTPSANATYHFAKLKADTFSYIIPADGRMEAIAPAPSETVLVIDGESEGWAYALLNGTFFKIKTADYDTVEITAKEGDYATKNNTALYTLPNVESTKLPALAGTRFELVSDCADFENEKWLRVNYNDKIYFVSTEECGEYIELIPEEQKKYGRAKAKRVGGLVGIYAEESTSSQMLMEIVDGTKIEVLDKLDAFYLVRYENTVGYMLKTEVQIDGLTTVQIVSIVVACIVAVAGIGIFIAIEITKKKAQEAERKASRS